MAVITSTSKSGSDSRTVTVTTLGASDTFTYVEGMEMYFDNVTAGALTPLLLGDSVVNVPVIGADDVDTSAGKTLASIGAGEQAMVPLDTIKAYLTGTCTVTGGDGIKVSLMTK